jgi:hypothetical protein
LCCLLLGYLIFTFYILIFNFLLRPPAASAIWVTAFSSLTPKPLSPLFSFDLDRYWEKDIIKVAYYAGQKVCLVKKEMHNDKEPGVNFSNSDDSAARVGVI